MPAEWSQSAKLDEVRPSSWPDDRLLESVTHVMPPQWAPAQPQPGDFASPSEARPAETSEREQVARFAALIHALTPRLWVTPTLIAINLAIFVAMLIAGRTLNPPVDLVLAWGADYGPRTLDGQWWRLVSSIFLHFTLVHVGLNMWVLWDLGQLVERLVGNVGFLVLYLVSGLGGCIASLAWNPTAISAGASGAVFGVAGALLGFLALRRDSVPAAMLSHLRSSMVTFVGFNVIFGFLARGMNIDNAAHLGGLATGIGCGLMLSQKLSSQAAAWRPLRNAVTGVVGLVAVIAGFWLLPPAPPDVLGELMRFDEVASQVNSIYSDAAQKYDDRKITPAEMVHTLEHDVLPPWEASLQRLERLEHAKGATQDMVSKTVASVRLRREGWQALIVALRDDDREAMERFKDRWEAANKLLEENSAGR
ncbi:MAG TPA: rhomboid family intramembrane serine protease [Pirellulaceae bacterium]|nr:rhomboid family intramembrane serine protease [Pirellulaceae bacterium]